MTEGLAFKAGDVVVHARCREWGNGVIEQAMDIVHDGVAAQRLVIRFKHHGRTIINTGVARLLPGEQTSRTSEMTMTGTATTDRKGGWLAALEDRNRPSELWGLPDALNDPFLTLKQRLVATLETFRFADDARSLIDWAIAQTGLNDPLSKYTRQDLEQGHARFARDRDRHLVDLVKQGRREGELGNINQVLRETRHPKARAALESAIRA